MLFHEFFNPFIVFPARGKNDMFWGTVWKGVGLSPCAYDDDSGCAFQYGPYDDFESGFAGGIPHTVSTYDTEVDSNGRYGAWNFGEGILRDA